MPENIKKIIIGNMKMNGSKEFNESLFSDLKHNLSAINNLDIVFSCIRRRINNILRCSTRTDQN